MHDHEHTPGHIPPPDPSLGKPLDIELPRKKRPFGIEPKHIVFAALVLVGVLILYLLLLARAEA
jgi:hypothetical protein